VPDFHHLVPGAPTGVTPHGRVTAFAHLDDLRGRGFAAALLPHCPPDDDEYPQSAKDDAEDDGDDSRRGLARRDALVGRWDDEGLATEEGRDVIERGTFLEKQFRDIRREGGGGALGEERKVLESGNWSHGVLKRQVK